VARDYSVAKVPQLAARPYVVRHGGTWAPDPDGFLLWVFSLDFIFYFQGDWSLRTGPTPPLEWTSFPSLVTAVSITRKGAESPGSRRIGVIGALVYFLLSKTVGARGGGGL